MIFTNSNQNHFDVIIIGAGPAGAFAAYSLAKKGVKVLILEKEKLPRYKVCGGGVVSRIKKILPFSLNSVIEDEFYTVDIFDHSTKLHFKTTRSKPIIMMSMRQNLDAFMLSKAMEAGATLYEEHEVKEVLLFDNEVQLSTNFRKFCAGLTTFMRFWCRYPDRDC